MDEKGAKPEDETNKNKKGKDTYDEQKCGSNHKHETLGQTREMKTTLRETIR